MTLDVPFPISLPVAITELLHGDPRQVSINADNEQCQALADYLGIPEVRSLTASVILKAEPGRTFILEGDVEVDLVQSCVVTMNPIETKIKGPIRRIFQDQGSNEEDPEMDPFDDDAPDEVEGGQIDAGGVICEHIALEMEPYPRHPDAPASDQEAPESGENAAEGRDNPFAVLAQMRNLEK